VGGVSGGLPALDQELDRLRAQLADLTAHYTDRHPDVRKIKEQIAKTERMKQQIAANLRARSGEAQAAGDPGTDPQDAAEIRDRSPLMELQSQLKANQIEIANRQRSIKDLQAGINAYQVRLDRSPVREQQLADLTRDYDQSRKNYDSLLAKRNDSELATNLERRQEGEQFRILDPPSLPTKPYSPNRLKLGAIGLFLGLVLGAAIAGGVEVTDDRIYSEKEFKKLLPFGVIGEIPPLTTAEEERHQRRSFLLGWLGTGLMAASVLAGFVISYLHG
jgi:uncharacterized protein involved in exopolysaccharide biosynthesis